MPLEHHPLAREFPEQRAKIAKLIGENSHFTRLAGTYEELDRRIYDIEDGREVWVADPFDPALEGAPYPFRFKPIYFEDVKKVPGAGLRRLADRYVDWVPAAK